MTPKTYKVCVQLKSSQLPTYRSTSTNQNTFLIIVTNKQYYQCHIIEIQSFGLVSPLLCYTKGARESGLQYILVAHPYQQRLENLKILAPLVEVGTNLAYNIYLTDVCIEKVCLALVSRPRCLYKTGPQQDYQLVVQVTVIFATQM